MTTTLYYFLNHIRHRRTDKFWYTYMLLCALCGSIFTKTYAQNTIGLISYQPDKSYDGYNLFYPHNQSTAFLTDNCGQIVHTWEDDAIFRPGNMVYILENGNLIRCKRLNNPTNDSIWAGGGGAIVEIRSWENELLWSFEQNNDTARLHHDVAPMPNGNILMLAWELKTGEEALQAGRNPDLLPRNKLWPDYIYEIDPTTDEIVWEWHVWDHLIQDFDPAMDNFGVVAAHPELVDINWDTNNGAPDWMHSNALDYNPVLDQIVLSVPYFHEIWVIDHSTTTAEAAGHIGGNSGMGGDLLYRWGNPATYRQGIAEDQQLFFSHDIHWVNPKAEAENSDFGKMAVFNNRVGENYSTANIFSTPIDADSKTYQRELGAFGPVGFEKIVKHPMDSTFMHSNSVSSTQVLPNGNILACAGRWGQVWEFTPENEIAWEYIIPIKAGSPAVQGDTLKINQNLTFRLKRYALDYPGFEGRDLEPKQYLELEPNENFCRQILPVTPKLSDEIVLFPNPAREYFQINMGNAGKRKIRIWDLMGRKVYDDVVSSTATIQTYAWNPGLYLVDVEGYVVKRIWVQ